MKRLKELQEQRGTKAAELEAILAPARTEKRNLKTEEFEKFDALEKQIQELDTTIGAEVRTMSVLSQKSTSLSKGEERNIAEFDFSKLLNHLHRSMNGASSGPLDGIEAEMVQEGHKEARASQIRHGGLMLPRVLVRRMNGQENRDLSATGGSGGDQGGMTIATEKRGLLDDFYNASIMRQAGATVLEGLIGNLDLPRLIKGSDPVKKTENEAAGEVSPTTAMLSMNPNRLPAFMDIGEQLLMQSSAAIESLLRGSITSQMLAVQEAAFFHGTGTSEAEGIAATSGIGSVAGGTNGLAPALTHLVQLEEKVDAQNALLGNLHYVSNGQIRAKLKMTPKVASTDSRMLLDDNGLVNSYVPYWTNAVSRTLTKGTADSVASAIFFGNFIDYIIGYWGGISLEMIRDSANAKVGQYTLVASAYYDGGVIRPKSFAAMLDALGAA